MQGTHLTSGSGDSSVKLWSFEQQKCVATYADHTQAVWGVAFHDLGDFVASCSLDHSVRLWDITTSKCRQSFRWAPGRLPCNVSVLLWGAGTVELLCDCQPRLLVGNEESTEA